MVSLGNRIYNLANNMKFQTASISRNVMEQDKRLDAMREGIASLENGICNELKDLRESQTTLEADTETVDTSVGNATSSRDTRAHGAHGAYDAAHGSHGSAPHASAPTRSARSGRSGRHGAWTKPIGYGDHW